MLNVWISQCIYCKIQQIFNLNNKPTLVKERCVVQNYNNNKEIPIIKCCLRLLKIQYMYRYIASLNISYRNIQSKVLMLQKKLLTEVVIRFY